MTDKKLTRRAVAKGLTLSLGGLALPSVAIISAPVSRRLSALRRPSFEAVSGCSRL